MEKNECCVPAEVFLRCELESLAAGGLARGSGFGAGLALGSLVDEAGGMEWDGRREERS